MNLRNFYADAPGKPALGSEVPNKVRKPAQSESTVPVFGLCYSALLGVDLPISRKVYVFYG